VKSQKSYKKGPISKQWLEAGKQVRRYFMGLVAGLLVIVIVYGLIMTFVENPEIQNLPYYTFRTLLRITVALILSVAWGVSFGTLASTNKVASTVLIPFIDLLQSIPILGYFPLVIMLFISAFQGSELGVELSAILLLFTSMAWAIFFGVVGAVRGIPVNVIDSAESFGLKGWRYIRHVVLPAIVPALVSGSTLAWCDGWFFMIAAEYITYGGTTYALPGLGSYLARAAYPPPFGYYDLNLAVILLILITLVVIFINYASWHRLMERASMGTYKPVVRLDLSGVGKLASHVPMKWLHIGGHFHWPRPRFLASVRLRKYTRLEKTTAIGLAFCVVLVITYLITRQFPSFEAIQRSFLDPELAYLPLYVVLTIGRLTIAYFISLGIALFMGILAAENKRFAMIFYPIYDIGQAVPILALFPILFMALSRVVGGALGLEITCITMLILDMIWYMFLNVVSAVKNIPSEIREVGQLFGFKGLRRVTHLVIPSILPAIVTGSILSWGTGWNTIIFSEYMPFESPPLWLPGLGYFLVQTGNIKGNTILLFFLLFIVAAIVLSMEAFVWRRLLRKFEKYRVEV